MEMSLTLPWMLFALVFIFIAYTFGKEAVAQKIFFIGTGWLMGIMGIGSVHIVAGENSYPGVQTLAEGALYFLIPAMLFWLIYIIAKTFTDAGSRIWSQIGK